MKRLNQVLRALDRTTKDGRTLGLWVGLASGLFVAAPVARLFLMFDDDTVFVAGAGALGTMAFMCTTIGTVMALRADTHAKAIGWVAILNILPPTLVCVPTIYGVVFSFPSGVLAFTLVTPLVLYARRARHTPGQASRERLAGALALAAMTVAMVATEAALIDDPYPRRHGFELLPLTLVALAALGLALSTSAIDVYRLWLWLRVSQGHVPGLRARKTGAYRGVIEAHVNAGAGPMRTAQTSVRVGELSASPVRSAVGLAMALCATVVAGAAAWAWTLQQPPTPW